MKFVSDKLPSRGVGKWGKNKPYMEENNNCLTLPCRNKKQRQLKIGGVNYNSSSVWTYGLIGVLAAACFWNTLPGHLIHDDVVAIKSNADVKPTTPISQLFRNDFWGRPLSSAESHKSYRPLTVLTFR
jgi:hypothetical protein